MKPKGLTTPSLSPLVEVKFTNELICLVVVPVCAGHFFATYLNPNPNHYPVMPALTRFGRAAALPKSRCLLRCVCTVFLFGLFSSLSFAQSATATVEGRVNNAVTGRYLNNARVTAVGTGKTVFTNAYGEYRVTGVPAGEVTLEVFYTGLDTETVTVDASGGGVVNRNVSLIDSARYGDLDDDTVVLDEFTVQAAGLSGDATAINEQRFSSNLKNVVDADAFGDVTEGNPGEFVKFLPGVSVDYVAADVRSISVRGFGSAFTSVNVDGNRMASAASSGASRSFELEQVSMNNVSRIELVKVPTPSMPADSLGGSVNLVSKNAFERDGREIKYRAYLSMNDEDLSFGKSPGPGRGESRKIRPGFDFSYADPLTENFGIVFNALRSDQFNEQHRSRRRMEWNSGDAEPDNPVFRRYELQDGPKETLRQSIGLNADWKITEAGVLSVGYQWNDYDSFFGNRNYTWNAGSSIPDSQFDSTYTLGRTGSGEITGATSFRNKFGSTHHISADFKHFGETFTVMAGGYYSYATNEYNDIDNGHFSNVGTRQRKLTIRFDGITDIGPTTITATDADGNDVTTPMLSNLNLRSARSQQYDSWDEFTGAHLKLRKSIESLSFPLELEAGIQMREQTRDLIRRQDDYNYVGADGSSESSDDNALRFLDDVYVNQDPHFGWEAPQWISPYKVYDEFLAHPDYFEARTSNWSNRVQNDYNITEEITSYYAQAEATFMDGKLTVLGGFRFEDTSIDALGFARNDDAIYDGNGNLISDDPYTQQRLIWQRRAQRSKRDYDGVYPSLHFNYNISDNLIVRLAYAKTLGRPDFSNILPGTVIQENDNAQADEPGGRITARNTGLLPYEGDSYDLSVEYYFKPAGVLSLGVFQKNLTDFFGASTVLVGQQELDEYGLDSQYLGWELSTTFNSGDAKVTGWEFNYVQQLNMLPSIWQNLGIFANGTFLDLSGESSADFRGFIEETYNYGISYTGKKLDVKLKFNHRGEQVNRPQTLGGVAGYEYYGPRDYVDLNVEYAFTDKFSVFANARNIFNEQQTRLIYADVTPDWARTERTEEFGVQLALGVKGKF